MKKEPKKNKKTPATPKNTEKSASLPAKKTKEEDKSLEFMKTLRDEAVATAKRAKATMDKAKERRDSIDYVVREIKQLRADVDEHEKRIAILEKKMK